MKKINRNFYFTRIKAPVKSKTYLSRLAIKELEDAGNTVTREGEYWVISPRSDVE